MPHIRAKSIHRFRRYAPRMLRALDIKAAPVANPLMCATRIIKDRKDTANQPTAFLRRNSKWHRQLQAQATDDHQLWEVAVVFHLRDAFRSEDIWLIQSRRYADMQRRVQIDPKIVLPDTPGTTAGALEHSIRVKIRDLVLGSEDEP